jgi:hypothetical protein
MLRSGSPGGDLPFHAIPVPDRRRMQVAGRLQVEPRPPVAAGAARSGRIAPGGQFTEPGCTVLASILWKLFPSLGTLPVHARPPA